MGGIRPWQWLVIIGLAVGLAGLIGLRLALGRQVTGEMTWGLPGDVILDLRLTSAIVGLIVGVSLGLSGLMLQALLRNPLASPFILGLSSGSALGVMVVIYLAHRLGTMWGPAAEPIAALAGAAATLGLVYMLGRRRGWLDPLSLVLVGVVVSAMCGALIMLLQHLVPQGLRGNLVTWMMGNIDQGVRPSLLWLCGGVAGVGLLGGLLMSRAMDAAMLGDDEARSIGLSLPRLRLGLFTLAGALAAMSVALAGPIGFVGLIAPHAARLLLGPGHRSRVLGAALAGAILVIAADVLSQIVAVRGGRMPVGVFTALAGGPAFLLLIRSRGSQL